MMAVLAQATTRFRFSDANPQSSGTYAQSRFWDLPEHVAYVVTELYNVNPVRWDELVDLGEAYEVVSPFRIYRVARAGSMSVVEASCSSCSGSGSSRRSATGYCQGCGGSGEVALLGESDTRAVERAETLAWMAKHRSAVAA